MFPVMKPEGKGGAKKEQSCTNLQEVNMIYTVTFNPAIDYVVMTDTIRPGEVNRANEERMYFGGKGINVSLVLRELGIKSRVLGFVAGFTGEAIENGLALQGIETGFVRLKNGFSRINVKIKSDEETELNGRGPDIPDDAVAELFERLEMIKDGDTLVLAGSIPPSLPSDIYEKILAHLEGRKDYDEADYSHASGFLIGNEAKGLSNEISARADCYIRIPMQGRVESLNASVASALLMYEAFRQRKTK